MDFPDLPNWLDEYSAPGIFWYIKRLSGNDTLANGSHQAGPYLPKPVFFRLFPRLEGVTDDNPDAWFDLFIDSHPNVRRVRAVWYNNKLRGGTRDEMRVTNLGGAASALLDPESTGALAVFAFGYGDDGHEVACNVWVCRNGLEEDLIEQKIGPVEPGRWTTWPPKGGLLRMMQQTPRADCRLEQEELPPDWLMKFPTGMEIIRKVIELRPDLKLPVDYRILSRRDCEFELFQSLEEAVELPHIRPGFNSIDDFIVTAQTVLQRRKARGGKSLKYHMREILIEEGFQEGKQFSWQPKAGNNPDFLFPSEAAYADSTFPRERIRMLAVKTTFRDRWHQVAKECADLPVRHLLTLQEGVSEAQFRQITGVGIRLVVPEKIIAKYAKPIRPDILTLEAFMADVRVL